MAKRKFNIQKLVGELNAEYKRIGTRRDKLRDLLEEAEEIVSALDQAEIDLAEIIANLQSLDQTIDDLSKYL